MICKVILLCLASLISVINSQNVDVYEIDLDQPHHYFRREQKYQPKSYYYNRQNDYVHVFPGGFYPQPEPEAQFPKPNDPEPEPQYYKPSNPAQHPNYQPIDRNEPNFQPPMRRPTQGGTNVHRPLAGGPDQQPLSSNGETDLTDQTFGEELKRLITEYVRKKYSTLSSNNNNGLSGLPQQPSLRPEASAFNPQPGDQNSIDKTLNRPNRMSLTDAQLMSMMTSESVFFHGLTLSNNHNNSAQCTHDPNVNLGKKIEYIFESSDTDTLLNTSCNYACEFEIMGLLKDNKILNKGMLTLVNVMYNEVPASRVIGYMQRMLHCLEALGNYGDRCHTASKLLLCGFMKQTKIASCMRGFTYINGQRRCATENIFEDNFDGNKLDKLKWKPTIKISSTEDEEFVVYDTNQDNIHVTDGKLVIRPTLMNDEVVASGSINLKKCTGHYGSPECTRKSESFNILPPVMSAQITSAAYFQYAHINIRAKLPQGDWIVPQMWLEPKNREFGPLLNSGRVVIGKCVGNSQLMDELGNELGMRSLSSGIVLGADRNIRFELGQMNVPSGWHDQFHNFTLFWDEEGMIFSVDGKIVKIIGRNGNEPLSDSLRFSKDEIISTWPDRKHNTPFDQEFRLRLGVSVGGNMEFPDNSVTSNNHKKPWLNQGSTKSMLNFWKDRHNWHKTWDSSKSAMEVEYVKVTALK